MIDTKSYLQKLLFQQLHGSCWNKLVRRACYKMFDIRFPERIILWEDLFVNCNLALNPIKVAYLPKAFYYYDCLSNSESIVRTPRIEKVQSQIRFINYFEKWKQGRPWMERALEICKHSTKDLAYKAGLSVEEVYAMWPETNGSYAWSFFRSPRIRRLRGEIMLAFYGFPRLGHTYYVWCSNIVLFLQKLKTKI